MISDQAARDTALLADRSFIVQAPAGSGKTGLLVYRLLTLLARVERPEQILAITFTRKATSEMRQRLLELLQLAEQGKTSEDAFEQQGINLATAALKQDEKYNWQLLDAPHQLQIQTIDAFCGKLTGYMPWLSRLGDRPRTTENAEQHYGIAIEQLLGELLNDTDELSQSLRTVMLELDFDYNRARKLFSAMLARRDQWLRHILQNNLTQMREELEQAWSRVSSEHFVLLKTLLPTETLQTVLRIGAKAADYLIAENRESPILALQEQPNVDELEWRHWQAIQTLFLTGSDTLRKSINVSSGFPPHDKAHKEELKNLWTEFEGDTVFLDALSQVKHLPENKFSDTDWQQLVALVDVLKALAAFLQLRFRSVGECDHSEVTQRANLALTELQQPTDLALRMDYQINHILVDEFQDTSHGQLQLLRKLTSGWSREDTDRTLFLVGDPMQSIYRFREADVSLFLQAARNDKTHLFDNIQIEALQLSENFRSSGQLVSWFNRVFSESFPKRDEVLTGAISYASASHKQLGGNNNKSQSSEIITHLANDKEDEATLVVKALKNALATIPEKAKVAVLVRSRTHLATLVPLINKAGISYSGVDIQPLNEAQAIIDITALCKALCRMDDRVAWLSLLRGPWCGLSLLQIKQIIGNSKSIIWQQLLNHDASDFDADSQARLQRFCAVMRQALEQRQQVGLHSVVRWAWQSLGGEETLFGTAIEDVYELFSFIES